MKKQASFKESDNGTYVLERPVTEKEIIHQASELLFLKIQRETMTASKDVRKFFEMKLAGEEREHLGVLYLDASHGVLDFAIEFSGTVDSAAVFPRIILQNALKLGVCAAAIVVHNHPSGSLEFSQADRQITKQIKEVLGLCEIRLIDSVLVSRLGSVSMAERGLL